MVLAGYLPLIEWVVVVRVFVSPAVAAVTLAAQLVGSFVVVFVARPGAVAILMPPFELGDLRSVFVEPVIVALTLLGDSAGLRCFVVGYPFREIPIVLVVLQKMVGGSRQQMLFFLR